jgi:hypothetical protein
MRVQFFLEQVLDQLLGDWSDDESTVRATAAAGVSTVAMAAIPAAVSTESVAVVNDAAPVDAVITDENRRAIVVRALLAGFASLTDHACSYLNPTQSARFAFCGFQTGWAHKLHGLSQPVREQRQGWITLRDAQIDALVAQFEREKYD